MRSPLLPVRRRASGCHTTEVLTLLIQENSRSAMNEKTTTISDEDRQRIEQAIKARRNEIASVDWDLINDEVGVLQAESQLRAALDQVLERLKAKDYQGVGQLGYGEVASGFIFLQRVMGGMQMNGLRRSSTISDIAGDVGLTYEQVAPFAEAAFEEARKQAGNKSPETE